MRITKIVLVLIFSFQSVFSQEKLVNVTLSFEDAKIENVIQHIESITDYKFFYISNWLGDNTISGDYKNVSINIVLNDIFRNTPINFYIDESSNIILTRNNIIHDKLPDDFFVVKEKNVNDEFEVKNISNPVFYEDDALDKENEIVRIGKENRGSSLK